MTFVRNCFLYGDDLCDKLDLPESLVSIGEYSFAEMAELGGISIPDKVTSIGKYAFFRDRKLEYAKLSASCGWLQEGVFSDCSVLASITIPSVVVKMDSKLFRACGSLTAATFDGSADIIYMGYGATDPGHGLFRDCPLETLDLDRWLSYDTYAPSRSPFYSIAELKNLKLGQNVKVIDKYMFSYCTALEEVLLPDHIESVGLWGFRGCSSLKNVRLSANLSQISDYGFAECTSLDNVVFPSKMTSVADHSFADCTSLRKLDLGNSLNIIGPAAFKNDTRLEGIVIPETLYGLGVESFANCSSLPNVTIRAISSVGKQAFQGCTGLQWVSLSDRTTSLGQDAFAGCTGIRYVKSYAEYAPEGLVNFPEDVVAAGTLFVPEASIDYYRYSPTWEDWMSIRPVSDNVLVSSVTLSETEHDFKASETFLITAIVGADDATDKNIQWKSSDENIATVDGNGLVTAVAVGEASVTATATDGSGVMAECLVRVIPTMVESITFSSTVTSLKKNRTLQLVATVLPASATDPEISWSTSDGTVATVSAEGVVTAVSAGNVSITATAADGSGIRNTFALTVIPPTLGDSNDNDELTITDAVNTANYAVGNEVVNFCFEAADVNGDNRITLADASGTVEEVLNQPVQSATGKMRRVSPVSAVSADVDRLVVAGRIRSTGNVSAVDVTLDNTVDYVALQADITVPAGMTVTGVEVGSRAASHSLMYRRIDDRTMRVALFSLDNEIFADNSDPLFRVFVNDADIATDGNIILSGIIASDAEAREYVLSSIGGGDAGVSDISSVYGDGNTVIRATAGGITVYNAEGDEVCDIQPAEQSLTVSRPKTMPHHAGLPAVCI